MCTMDYPKFIASNQKEESISIQRVKCMYHQYYKWYKLQLYDSIHTLVLLQLTSWFW